MPEGGRRLDLELAARGLARSRTHAARLVAAGQVEVDGRTARRAAASVGPRARIEVLADDAHYVSRGAHKLLAALDAFGLDPAGRDALDVGASTGGFTQVLLERGARRVVALDVGHGQLAPRLRADARVHALEGVNARELDAAALDGLLAAGPRPAPAARGIDLVTADVSFIPLGLVLPALRATVSPAADHLLLIKPQFEVGRSGVRDGVVHDPRLAAEAVRGVLRAAAGLGLTAAGLAASPLAGVRGNREYLVHLRAADDAAERVPGLGVLRALVDGPGDAAAGMPGPDGPDPSEWEAPIRRATKGAEA
ncbi:MAG: TlyA family RNA methyltransferase [Pseudoclavibacter sp.]|nr:TlyA family RNA methyltransferase [Pseudoclavibacter sp.]